jgi:ribosomal protein S9
METIHKIGRRKTSVARVYLTKGKGVYSINGKSLEIANLIDSAWPLIPPP